jgi:hypothetical protein
VAGGFGVRILLRAVDAIAKTPRPAEGWEQPLIRSLCCHVGWGGSGIYSLYFLYIHVQVDTKDVEIVIVVKKLG